MKVLSRRGFTTGALAIVSGACGGLTAADDGSPGTDPSTRAPSPPDPGTTGDEPPAPKPADPRLSFAPVAASAAPPAVLWSWTTAEQAAEIRRDARLFTREPPGALGRGYLFDVLADRAANGDAAASRLAGSELAKGRFGWSNPWATVRGADVGETSSLELLRIEMRPDTWFARVRTYREAITFVDSAGQPVSSAAALASFDRVGGILFENDAESFPSCSTGVGRIYREIYVGNEARLATFSHRTASMLATLDDHIAELSAFRAWLAAGGEDEQAQRRWTCLAASTWRSTPRTTLERYLASLAFATPPYGPDATNVQAIVNQLKSARFTPDPFTHRA